MSYKAFELPCFFLDLYSYLTPLVGSDKLGLHSYDFVTSSI